MGTYSGKIDKFLNTDFTEVKCGGGAGFETVTFGL